MHLRGRGCNGQEMGGKAALLQVLPAVCSTSNFLPHALFVHVKLLGVGVVFAPGWGRQPGVWVLLSFVLIKKACKQL